MGAQYRPLTISPAQGIVDSRYNGLSLKKYLGGSINHIQK